MIESESIRLRYLSYDDGPAIRLALEDGRVAKALPGLPWPYPDGSEYAFIANSVGTDYAVCGLVDGTDRFLGAARLGAPISISQGDFEIGYWVVPDFWRHGIGTKVVECLIDLAQILGANSLGASVAKDNIASLGVIRKHNFECLAGGEDVGSALGGELPSLKFFKNIRAPL